ncbi:translation elongation factor 4, partial [Spirochaetota bacterium]
DNYRGTVVLVRIMNGTVRAGDKITFFFNNKEYDVEEVGKLCIQRIRTDALSAGDVGYVIAGIKSVSDTKIGDTITNIKDPCKDPLKGYKEVKPMVFAGFYPIVADEYEELKSALEKLKLNDASLLYEQHNSHTLGFGFRCGFLGLLHMEIIQERLEREFDAALVATAPTVRYRIGLVKGKSIEIDNPVNFPQPETVEKVYEPFVKATIITPSDFLGNIMQLTMDKRGIQKQLIYLDEKKVEVIYEMPLAEIIFDFYDKLKSATKGYASFDYEVIDYREVDLVKVDILVNAEKVDSLSFLTHKENARTRGKVLIDNLKHLIPHHMFKIPLQAAIGSQVIARENISAMRKNVTAKCYGGDVSRKRKLLEKQKEGKKRMRAVGKVNIPQEAFIAVLKS